MLAARSDCEPRIKASWPHSAVLIMACLWHREHGFGNQVTSNHLGPIATLAVGQPPPLGERRICLYERSSSVTPQSQQTQASRHIWMNTLLRKTLYRFTQGPSLKERVRLPLRRRMRLKSMRIVPSSDSGWRSAAKFLRGTGVVECRTNSLRAETLGPCRPTEK